MPEGDEESAFAGRKKSGRHDEKEGREKAARVGYSVVSYMPREGAAAMMTPVYVNWTCLSNMEDMMFYPPTDGMTRAKADAHVSFHLKRMTDVRFFHS
jgi:hypothetical protein